MSGHAHIVASVLGSGAVAAVIAGLVALIAAYASSKTAMQINRDKLKLDRELANLKAQQERELANHRMALEQLASWNSRRAEVAEQALTLFYRARRAIQNARSPMIWAHEMVPEEGVPDEVVRNSGYGVLRRLRKNEALFVQLEDGRFNFEALFGLEAAAEYDALIKVFNRVAQAAQTLRDYRDRESMRHLQRLLEDARHDAFAITWSPTSDGRLRDPLAEELDEIIKRVEARCRPAFERRDLADFPEFAGRASPRL